VSAYDIVIIGGGPGGYVAALRAAQRGAKVALVERDRLGGTCLNRGCIPTKAMVRDAEVYREATSGIYGVDAEGGWRVNYARLLTRRRAVVEGLVQGVARLLATQRVAVFAGEGRIARAGLVEVRGAGGVTSLEGRTIIIASGSVPAHVPIPGVELPGVVTSDGLLALERLPQSLVVIGASVVGMEFACILAALGTRVTVLGRKTFLREAEPQLAKRLRAMLAARGMTIAVGLEFREITRGEDGLLRVAYEQQGKVQAATGEVVLLSTGRVPYTEGLGLEALGVAMNGRAIAVDAHLQTSIPGLYAIGDCLGGQMLAHVASYQGEVAVENILGGSCEVDYRVVPSCIFTMPEIAGVGITEAEAKEQGLAVKVSRFPFNVSGRAVAMGEEEGQIRMICAKGADGRGGAVLGVHIMGPHASDLVAEAALAMRLGATAEDIARTIHAHPTLPEALMEAAMGQGVGAIHYEQRQGG
jgi:dihydrolipoamide dehydrogenase